MTEPAAQQQGDPASPQNNDPNPTGNDDGNQGQRREQFVPRDRFDNVNKAKNEAEKKLQQIEEARQREEEERASSAGEHQKVLEKLREQLKREKENVQTLKSQMVRDERYRAWVAVASAHIRPNAIGDAFGMVTEDEWNSVNVDDENSVRMLAQNLAERKEYLQSQPMGAGARGANTPVFGLTSNNTSRNAKVEVGGSSLTHTQGGRATIHFKKNRPGWK
jgi:hypothetical protein